MKTLKYNLEQIRLNLNIMNLNFKTLENSIKTVIVLTILVVGVSATVHELINPTNF